MRKIVALGMVLLLLFSCCMPVFAAQDETAAAAVATNENDVINTKAIAAAAVIGAVGVAGALAMAFSIRKSVDGMARQPEASGSIRTSMMLGLVFIETVVIYALIVAILVVFVL